MALKYLSDIQSARDPQQPTDVANKRYVDAAAGGTTILSGTAAPTAGTGAVGDYYLDTDDNLLYGPKVAPVGANEYVEPSNSGIVGGPVTLGMKFQFNTATSVVGVHVFVPSTSSGTGWSVGLWQGSTLLASKSAGTLTANAWNNVMFDTPVSVTTGTVYVAGAYTPSGQHASLLSATYAGQTSGVVVGLAENVSGTSTVYDSSPFITRPSTPWANQSTGVSPIAVGTAPAPWPVAVDSVPPGGTTGQVLAKTSATNYATAWTTPTSGGVTDHGALTGLLDDDHPQYATVAGDTFTGLLSTVASNTTNVGLRIPHGTAPTSPVNGDVWTTTTGIYTRINGVTVGPLGTGGAVQTLSTSSTTTLSLMPGVGTTGTIFIAPYYRLLTISTNRPARVRLYTTVAKRTADISRPTGTYPTGDHGLILEYITTTSMLLADLSPTVDGFDGKSTPDGNIPYYITNNDTGAGIVTVTFSWI